MSFYIYENWTAEKKAIIHTGDCKWCNYGKGIHPNKLEGRNGRWHGPFTTYSGAANAAARLQNRPSRNHKACQPEKVTPFNIEMEIESVRASRCNNQRAIILKGKGQERYLPVRVEPAEADAIEFKLKNVATPRPLIHDLLCSLIQAFGGKVRLAIIHDVHKDTFFAKLVVEVRRKNFEFDCRPSDAIAVALIAKAPICVEKPILDKFGTTTDQIGEYWTAPL